VRCINTNIDLHYILGVYTPRSLPLSFPVQLQFYCLAPSHLSQYTYNIYPSHLAVFDFPVPICNTYYCDTISPSSSLPSIARLLTPFFISYPFPALLLARFLLVTASRSLYLPITLRPGLGESTLAGLAHTSPPVPYLRFSFCAPPYFPFFGSSSTSLCDRG